MDVLKQNRKSLTQAEIIRKYNEERALAEIHARQEEEFDRTGSNQSRH